MRRFTHRPALAALLLAGLLGACGGEPRQVEVDNPLLVDPASRDFSNNPKLLDRILASPHGYFRFINIPFSAEVCRRFGDTLAGTVFINLHGDAHLEQYAVTDLGRGLTDFDDTSRGPAVLDLLRLGVSLDLLTRERGWAEHSEELFDDFLGAYRAALEDADYEVEEPRFAADIRSGFSYERSAYFEWVESIMEPLEAAEAAELEAAMSSYIEVMRAERPQLDADFFDIRNLGRLRMGIGSALDLKYLVRFAGESDEPLDDVVVEVKEVRSLEGMECITAARGADPFRILVGQSRIAYQPYGLLGTLRFRDRAFWVHKWVDNYKELDVEESFSSVDELREVVADIGVQLGKGHPKETEAFDLQLRREQLRLLDENEARLRAERRDLADLTVAAWERFRARTAAE